jgi:hypothetical protein
MYHRNVNTQEIEQAETDYIVVSTAARVIVHECK